MDGFCRRGWQEKTRRLVRISLQGVMALYVPSFMNCDIFFHYYYIGGWDYEVVESFQLPNWWCWYCLLLVINYKLEIYLFILILQRAYYFSEHSLLDLFEGQGFTCKAVTVHCRQIENRSRSLVMNRLVILTTIPFEHSTWPAVQESLKILKVLLPPKWFFNKIHWQGLWFRVDSQETDLEWTCRSRNPTCHYSW